MDFTARQVMKLTSIPYQTLNAWTISGFITPSVANPKGTGYKRLWSLADVTAIKLVLSLRRGYVSQHVLKSVVSFLHTHDIENTSAEARLLISDGKIDYYEDKSAYMAALRRDAFGIIWHIQIPLGNMIEGLREDIERLEQAVMTNV